MKIIIPNYALEDTFVENVVVTLKAMGHTVITPPIRSKIIGHKYVHILEEVYEKIYPNNYTPQEKWLITTLKQNKADLLIALTQSIKEEILFEAKKRKIITVAWWGDTPANMRKEGLLCYGWDYIFIKDKYAAFKLNTLALNAHYLPEAMNPIWHKPLYTANEINDYILFAGNTYDYRHFLIRQLLNNNITKINLFGYPPPKWADKRLSSIYTKKYIIKEEKSKQFGFALACINSTAMSEGNSINCRAFEIAGAAGLQIMEYRQAIEDCFEPGKEILTFSNIDELIELLNKYSKDKDAAIKIRHAGHKRVLSSHTYEIRLKTIFSQIQFS